MPLEGVLGLKCEITDRYSPALLAVVASCVDFVQCPPRLGTVDSLYREYISQIQTRMVEALPVSLQGLRHHHSGLGNSSITGDVLFTGRAERYHNLYFSDTFGVFLRFCFCRYCSIHCASSAVSHRERVICSGRISRAAGFIAAARIGKMTKDARALSEQYSGSAVDNCELGWAFCCTAHVTSNWLLPGQFTDIYCNPSVILRAIIMKIFLIGFYALMCAVAVSLHAQREEPRLLLYHTNTDHGGGTNQWWLPLDRLEQLPKWRPEMGNEPTLSLMNAIKIGKKWIASKGVGTGDVDEIVLRPVHPEEIRFRSCFYYRIKFSVAPYANHLTCIVLMDGTVLEPTLHGKPLAK